MLPVWSPDSSQIAFILERDGQRQLAIAEPVEGARVRPVGPTTPATTTGIGYTWSPDGETLLITLLPEAEPRTFWAVDVATGSHEQVVDPGSADRIWADIPTWQRLAP
jgi:Tol biopolymer transport system component